MSDMRHRYVVAELIIQKVPWIRKWLLIDIVLVGDLLAETFPNKWYSWDSPFDVKSDASSLRFSHVSNKKRAPAQSRRIDLPYRAV